VPLHSLIEEATAIADTVTRDLKIAELALKAMKAHDPNLAKKAAGAA
jgi:hypothetical protein